jgi:ribonuclease HI
VAVGHVSGVYTDYASVEAQIRNCPGAKHQSFASRTEAQAFVNEFRRDASAPISLRGDLSEASSLAANKGIKAGESAPKKQKKNDGAAVLTNGDVKRELGTGPLPEGAEDGFDPALKLDPETGNIRVKTEAELGARKLQPTGDFSGPINIYTDGSSLGNGQIGAVGGVGVYFGPQDPRSVCAGGYPSLTNGVDRNISEPLRGPRQTNQRAELTAVARALDHVAIDRTVNIYTDSNYSIKCLTEWFQKWEGNKWRNSSGKDVENKDLIMPIIDRIRDRERCGAKTKLNWIKGHANDPGNTAADLLAVQGSRCSTPKEREVDIRTISPTLGGPTGHYQEETKMKAEPVDDSKSDMVNEEHFGSYFAEGSAQAHSAEPTNDDHDLLSSVSNYLAESHALEAQKQSRQDFKQDGRR